MQPEKIRISICRRATHDRREIGLAWCLCGRLYYLHCQPKYEADDNRINLRLWPRAAYRRQARCAMAVNVQNYRVVLSPSRRSICRNHGVGRSHRSCDYDRRRVCETRRRRAFVPITVRENLTWQEMSRIEVNAPICRE